MPSRDWPSMSPTRRCLASTLQPGTSSGAINTVRRLYVTTDSRIRFVENCCPSPDNLLLHPPRLVAGLWRLQAVPRSRSSKGASR